MNKKVIIIILIIILTIAGVNYYHNIKKINRLENKVIDLNNQIEVTLKKQEELKNHLDNIDNLEFIEKIARTKLGLVKPDEVLLIPLEEKDK